MKTKCLKLRCKLCLDVATITSVNSIRRYRHTTRESLFPREGLECYFPWGTTEKYVYETDI